MTPQELFELDIKVAEAAGIPVLLESWYLGLDDDAVDDPAYYPHVRAHDSKYCNLWQAPQEDGTAWKPSTNWNDAMFAAEKHPWVDTISVSRTKNLEWYANIGGSYAYAKTGPIAICQALLALSESK